MPGELFSPKDGANTGEYFLRYGKHLSIRLTLSEVAPHLRLTLIPYQTKERGRLLFPFTGLGIFKQLWQGEKAGSSFSPSLGMALLLSGEEKGDVVVEGDGKGDAKLICRAPAERESRWVMYMCYGPYPRVGEYLDLYAIVARSQFQSAGVVLETDCYYTARYDDLSKLHRQSVEDMYTAEEILNIADKRRHLNALGCDAA